MGKQDAVVSQMRYIMKDGMVYFRQDSVADMLRCFGGSEETDTRNRIDELAQTIGTIKPGKGYQTEKVTATKVDRS